MHHFSELLSHFACSVDANGNLSISGNLTVSGTKSSTAKVQNGREVALYAVESAENWFEDFGSGELKSGVVWVPLDASFAEATNAAVTYHVFLTPNGDSNGLRGTKNRDLLRSQRAQRQRF
ncbi:MAG TPA: hypothetical protein VHM93_18555 [Candidatus Acidoferrum sp.]|nr:hypothetical protein [Candidatus Acidoferrum sp.]